MVAKIADDMEAIRAGLARLEEENRRRIVAELEALRGQVDAVKLLQSRTAAELDALMPAILDKAFKGEL